MRTYSDRAELCTMCSGSGDCVGCDGSGHTHYDISGAEVCCQLCASSGQCQECGGAGLIDEAAP